jgi:CheY-like chemotaxis protein
MSPFRILVVEDEAIVAMNIEQRLSAMGYEPAGRVARGEEAIAAAQKLHPDLVLMDIRLQGKMDGITAAQQIRERLSIPVIFLTAFSEDPTLNRAKLAEPFGFILKPFEDRELKSAIEIALYKHKAEKEIRRLNRLYDVLSQVNQAIVRVESREELFETACRQIVERGNVSLAWIGRLDPATQQIITVTSFGEHRDFLSRNKFFADNRPEGQGSQRGRPFCV